MKAKFFIIDSIVEFLMQQQALNRSREFCFHRSCANVRDAALFLMTLLIQSGMQRQAEEHNFGELDPSLTHRV